jgi:hypothetical protein
MNTAAPLQLPAMQAAKSAARALLDELERHELGHAKEAGSNGGHAAKVSPTQRGMFGVTAESGASAPLQEENERLASELRALAAQLKQERAARRAAARPARTDSSGDLAAALPGRQEGAPSGDAAAAGGLTLANAASQILMLRREVKFLQKQWQSARRDADGSARRDELASLREAAERETARADAATERAAAAEARLRLLVRELGAARARMGAQQARMARRSAAQTEAASLRSRLGRAEAALHVAQAEARRQAMRAELRGAAGGEGGGAAGLEAAACVICLLGEIAEMEADTEAHVSAAAAGVRGGGWAAGGGGGAEGRPLSPGSMAHQLAAAEDERARMAAEAGELRRRLAEAQSGNHAHAAPPPPPPPPPPPSQDGGAAQLKEDMSKRFSSLATKFRNKPAR